MAKKKSGGLRLNIELPEGFEHREMEQGAPITFINDDTEMVFQVSIQLGAAEGRDFDDDDLIRIAVETGADEGVEPVQTAAEECEMGRYGMATFVTPERPVSNIWILTDGTHLLVATLICCEPPSEEKLLEVFGTVHSLNLVPA